MDEAPAPIDPERLRWLARRSTKNFVKGQKEQRRQRAKAARGFTKHPEGATRPTLADRRGASRKKARSAKASRKKNR